MPDICLLYTSNPINPTPRVVRFSMLSAPIIWPTACMEPSSFTIKAIKQQKKERITPVSYTHLDVYKRQGPSKQSRTENGFV